MTVHDLAEYQRSGFDPFIADVRAYLAGSAELPQTQANALRSAPAVVFSFSDALLRAAVARPQRLDKPYEVAVKYGLRGHSIGGVNGIVYQRELPNDRRLHAATARFIEQNPTEVRGKLGIGTEGFEGLRRVKIVWHQPSGKRIVGVYRPATEQMLFLDFASY